MTARVCFVSTTFRPTRLGYYGELTSAGMEFILQLQSATRSWSESVRRDIERRVKVIDWSEATQSYIIPIGQTRLTEAVKQARGLLGRFWEIQSQTEYKFGVAEYPFQIKAIAPNHRQLLVSYPFNRQGTVSQYYMRILRDSRLLQDEPTESRMGAGCIGVQLTRRAASDFGSTLWQLAQLCPNPE